EQRVLAGFVALGPRQAALFGPAAIAIHDQSHVRRHELGRDSRRPCAAGVRLRRLDRHPNSVSLAAGLVPAAAHTCSTWRSERIECSRFHWTSAATRPLHSTWSLRSLASASPQSPRSSALIKSIVGAAAVAAPGAQQVLQTRPPAATPNVLRDRRRRCPARSAGAGSSAAAD